MSKNLGIGLFRGKIDAGETIDREGRTYIFAFLAHLRQWFVLLAANDFANSKLLFQGAHFSYKEWQ
ncbi:hypothetical protein KDW_64420 [Dictyobacter vulcani]|uniref:Uncharacterized protein n=1 Tax=Dictyobacter vulcani TaxID=2607529 RepID=A0A5J4L0D7_9CHLR|nr:hypothetical protein KDW_64420 [Dictyobacter vulcani]